MEIKLRDILEDWNFWNKKVSKEETGYERDIVQDIIKFIDRREIIVLKGIRRSGKSTILYQIIDYLINTKNRKSSQTLFVNLEDFRFVNHLSIELLEDILNTYHQDINPDEKAYVLLDEVQNVPGWEKWLRTKYDLKRRYKFIITGSNSSLLSGEYSTLLTGRNISFTVTPFTFLEFLKVHQCKVNPTGSIKDIYYQNKPVKDKILYQLSRYMRNGGFPETLSVKSTKDVFKLLQQYFDDILFKDIIMKEKIRTPLNIRNLALFLMANTGNLLSYNKLAAAVNVSTNTVIELLEKLQDCFLVRELNRFSFSMKISKLIQQPKKFYSIDTGLRNAVVYDFTKDFGRLAENTLFNHLREKKEIGYWKGKYETDFIIKKSRPLPLEITYTDKITEKEYRGLVESAQQMKVKEGILITKDTFIEKRNEGINIKVYPLWLILLCRDFV